MENTKSLKNKILRNKLLVTLIIIGVIVFFYLDNINDKILFLTFLALIWYAWETKRMKNEIVTQTELSQKPILVMYIRDINKYDEKGKEGQKEYCINTRLISLAENFDKGGGFGSDLRSAEKFRKYLVRVRNVGKGPAFNMEVSSENFKVEKYQGQFFAPEPKGDEQSIKIIRKDGEEIKGDYSDLNDSTFKISYENVNKKPYRYKYKIVDVEKQIVKFIG